MSLFAEPFPDDILEEIRHYPGNEKCCDCPSIDTDWASVSHGTLICLDCAGKHRSLGVHVSFVRSITMDTWSSQQVEMMKQGGNGQIRTFFKKLEIENSPVQILYCTKGASLYRDKLKERVEKIIKGEIKPERRVIKKARSPSKDESKGFVDSLLDQSQNGLKNNKDDMAYTVSFEAGTMGMTLTKDYRDFAVISKLAPGGAAQIANVRVGDYIIGVAGRSLHNYDEIMHMIPCMPRPLDIKFCRVHLHHSKSTADLTNQNHHVNHNEESLNHSNTPKSNHKHPIPHTRSPADDHHMVEHFLESQSEKIISKTSKGLEPSEDSEKIDDIDKLVSRSKSPATLVIEAGSIVKVLQSDSKWRNAMIRRPHKDGSFKIMYRDGSTESHVEPQRIALSIQSLQQMGIQTESKESSPSISKPVKESLSQSLPIASKSMDEEFNMDEFKVTAYEDLDAWIENDLSFDNLQTSNPNSSQPSIANGTKLNNEYVSLEEAEPPVKISEIAITFIEPPLGLTLSANSRGEPEVTKIKPEGRAEKGGLMIGDTLFQIDTFPVAEYEEAMNILPNSIYPLILHFKRPSKGIVAESSEILYNQSVMLANSIMDSMGLNKSQSILSQHTAPKLSNRRSEEMPTSASSYNTRTKLGKEPLSGEFDLVITQNELGFKIEERIGKDNCSVVTEVLTGSYAKENGLSIGCVIVGINYEPYLSHAHSVSTLKYAKRPVAIRFKNKP